MNALIHRIKRALAASRDSKRRAAVGRPATRHFTPRRLTVGLGVAADRVRAVGVAGDTVRWAIELERSEGEPLGEKLRALLARCPLDSSPLGCWPRPRVAAAIGPSAVQVKRLTGLPPLEDPAALASLVREGAGRFFLRNGVPLLTTGVRLVEPGTAWAAAFDAPIVEQVERACASAGLRVRIVAPSAIALGRATNGRQISWVDGDVRAELAFSEGKITAVRQVAMHHGLGHHEVEEPASPVAALASLGGQALAFADAYGATRLGRDEPLALRPGRASLGGSPSQARTWTAAATLGLTVIAALVGPPVAASRATTRARARLQLVGAQLRTARAVERDLGQISGALEEAAAFNATHRSATMLLADITRALPKEAALVAFEIDSATGTLVAITPRASRVTTALEGVRGIASPQIVGPVTRAMAGGGELEQVTVRFQLTTPVKAAKAMQVLDATDSSAKAPSAAAPGAASPNTGAPR